MTIKDYLQTVDDLEDASPETPLEAALRTYDLIVNDFNNGLNYLMSPELYNQCMETIGSPKRITESTPIADFCDSFYWEAKKGGYIP